MAKPRVFVSSTHYDLRSIRDDLDRFIREVGYEPVRHESGHIPYGKDARPEEYAYREIEFCDIVVCIIGGKYGTQSFNGGSSITQKEIKGALDRGKQVYIFVEDGVMHENKIYKMNKDIAVRFAAVDDVRIHEFLEVISNYPRGNPIFTFSVSSDIIFTLKEQWAGLFQRLLSEAALKPQAALVDELQRSLHTVGMLVEFLSDKKEKGDDAINQILMINHPFFAQLKDILSVSYKFCFTTLEDVNRWLVSAMNFKMEDDNDWGSENFSGGRYVWSRKDEILDEVEILEIDRSIFTEVGDLRPFVPGSWNEKFVSFFTREVPRRVVLRPSPPVRRVIGESGRSPAPVSKSVDLNKDDDIPF